MCDLNWFGRSCDHKNFFVTINTEKNNLAETRKKAGGTASSAEVLSKVNELGNNQNQQENQSISQISSKISRKTTSNSGSSPKEQEQTRVIKSGAVETNITKEAKKKAGVKATKKKQEAEADKPKIKTKEA